MVLESKIDRFIGNIGLGVNFFEDAAERLVDMIDEEPGVCERILALNRVDWLTKDVLDTFEAIGRKQLAVGAIFMPKHVLSRLIALPVDMQQRVIESPVTVYREAGRRRTDAVRVKPTAKLNVAEAKLAIGPNGVRSVDEQKALTNPAQEKSAGYFGFTLMNGKLFVNRTNPKPGVQRIRLKGNSAVVEIIVDESGGR